MRKKYDLPWRSKLQYLLDKTTFVDLARELRISSDTLKKARDDENFETSKNFLSKINKSYSERFTPPVLKLVRYVPSTVKNYDDEEMEDLKAGTSRHGSNRGSRSSGGSNNGFYG